MTDSELQAALAEIPETWRESKRAQSRVLHPDTERRKKRRHRQRATALAEPVGDEVLSEVELEPPADCPSPAEIARMAAEIRAENDKAAALKKVYHRPGEPNRNEVESRARVSGIRECHYAGPRTRFKLGGCW